MEEDLLAALLADAGVSAIAADRAAWGLRPQGQALPAIALHLIANPRSYTMEGREDLVSPLVQLDAWATSYAGAKLLGRAIIRFLDTLTMAPFQGAFVTAERDFNEPAEGPLADGSETFFRTSIEARIWHAKPL